MFPTGFSHQINLVFLNVKGCVYPVLAISKEAKTGVTNLFKTQDSLSYISHVTAVFLTCVFPSNFCVKLV